MSGHSSRPAAVARSHPVPVIFGFHDVSALRHTLRHTLRVQAAMCGLSDGVRDAFVLAVNEIAANAVLHGGGQGETRLWCDGVRLYCQISDRGPGLSATDVITQLPPRSASGGRGLWIAAQLCHLTVHNSTPAAGAVVELSVALEDLSHDAE